MKYLQIEYNGQKYFGAEKQWYSLPDFQPCKKIPALEALEIEYHKVLAMRAYERWQKEKGKKK